MQDSIEIPEPKKNKLLKRYVFIVTATNIFGFLWTMNPENFGVYVWLLILLPINIIYVIVGIIRVIVLQTKKTNINYLLTYSLVIVVPIVEQLLLLLFMDLFAPKGGC